MCIVYLVQHNGIVYTRVYMTGTGTLCVSWLTLVGKSELVSEPHLEHRRGRLLGPGQVIQDVGVQVGS